MLKVPLRVQTAREPLPADGGCRAQSRKGKKLSEAEGKTIQTTRRPGHLGPGTPKRRRGRVEAESAEAEARRQSERGRLCKDSWAQKALAD